MYDEKMTILTEGQMWGNDREDQIEVIHKYGNKTLVSDLAILTGAEYEKDEKGNVGTIFTQAKESTGNVLAVGASGEKKTELRCSRKGAIRPVILLSSIFSDDEVKKIDIGNGIYEVEYGEYPQYATDKDLQRKLEIGWQNNRIKRTGRSYSFDTRKNDDYYMQTFTAEFPEYEFDNKKYIRYRANTCYNDKKVELSNGAKYENGEFVWIEVSPVKWLVDEKSEMLISKIGLVSGIRFNDTILYDGNFSKTDIKRYIDDVMKKELFKITPKKIKYGISLINEIENIEQLIEWANYHHIHPSLISFISYKIKTNPNELDLSLISLEMASNLLKSSMNPYMLKSILGDTLSSEFVSFCYNQNPIEKVLNNFSNEEENKNNDFDLYTSIMSSTMLNEEDYPNVRDLVLNYDKDATLVCDYTWSFGNFERKRITYKLQKENTIEGKTL